MRLIIWVYTPIQAFKQFLESHPILNMLPNHAHTTEIGLSGNHARSCALVTNVFLRRFADAPASDDDLWDVTTEEASAVGGSEAAARRQRSSAD